jgi:gas vesicle protein
MREEHIGSSCDLYDKCFQMHNGWDLFAKEITLTKNKLSDLQQLEQQAAEDRKRASDKVDAIHYEFIAHTKEEMAQQERHALITQEHTKVLGELKDVIRELRDDHQNTKQELQKEVNDTTWIKSFGYGIAGIFGAGLIYIFLNINATDKMMVKIETNLERNTEVLKELQIYFRGDKQ